MVRAGVAVFVVVTASLFAPAAFASPDAGAPSRDAGTSGPDADALVVELDQQIAALSTGDCALACQSLGAMRRTADRICALDPGARCDKARDKVQDVARRVLAACPTCADTPGVVVAKPTAAPEAPPAPAEELAARKGGCAACSVGVGDDAGLGLFGAALALAALGRRRRAGRRRRM